jgi:hypothetical protein
VRQLKSTFISLFPLLPTKQDFFFWFIYQEFLRQRKALAILTATPLCAGYQVRLGYCNFSPDEGLETLGQCANAGGVQLVRWVGTAILASTKALN